MSESSRPFGRRPSPIAEVTVDSGPTASPAQPTWYLLFLAMIPALLIQQIPVVNVIIVFLLSPLWIGLLLNLGLLAMAADALRGAAPRWLLAVPIAVYGLNLVASGLAYRDYRALDQRLARENAASRLAFDSARTSLVAPGRLAEELVQRYALPVAYAAPDGAAPSAVLRVLPKATCDTIPQSPDRKMRTASVQLEDSGVDNACLLELPAPPPPTALTISVAEGDAAAAADLNRIVLTTPDGRQATLVQGRTKVLSPIPFPLVGCMTWTERQCQAEMFQLRPSVGQIEGRGARSVAAVLGLKPRAVSMVRNERGRLIGHLDPAETELLAVGSEPAVVEARAFGQQVVDRQFALLTGLIEGQDPGDERLDTWIIVTNADRVDAEALMAALERDLGAPGAAERRELLGEVAAGLKPDAFARIGPRLARVVAADRQLQEDDDLMIRLGDAGEPGARVLSSLLEQAQGRGARTYLTQGLCRAGTAGADAARLVTDTALADSDPELLQAALAAVLRMGRRDLAQQLVQAPIGKGHNLAGRRYHREWMEKALAQVTPASPPGVCRTLRNNYSLPDVAWLREGALGTRR